MQQKSVADGLIQTFLERVFTMKPEKRKHPRDSKSSRIFHLYGDVTITGEGLQNLDLCSALRAFEQGGIFIKPQLL